MLLNSPPPPPGRGRRNQTTRSILGERCVAPFVANVRRTITIHANIPFCSPSSPTPPLCDPIQTFCKTRAQKEKKTVSQPDPDVVVVRMRSYSVLRGHRSFSGLTGSLFILFFFFFFGSSFSFFSSCGSCIDRLVFLFWMETQRTDLPMPIHIRPNTDHTQPKHAYFHLYSPLYHHHYHHIYAITG